MKGKKLYQLMNVVRRQSDTGNGDCENIVKLIKTN